MQVLNEGSDDEPEQRLDQLSINIKTGEDANQDLDPSAIIDESYKLPRDSDLEATGSD